MEFYHFEVNSLHSIPLYDLGPQLFPCLEDSTGHRSVSQKLVSRKIQGQMCPCQPYWDTHGWYSYVEVSKSSLDPPGF
jgi:hypothetical protein